MKFRIAHSLAALVLLSGTWLSATAADAPAPVPAVTATPAIAGVVNAGTPIQLVKDGFEAVEGPMRDTDGSVLFTNNQAGRVLRAAADGTVSTWFEGPFGANALARTTRGEIVATLQKTPVIGVLQPGAPPRVLADKYDGKPFNRPNDLVADKRGNIYFTDSIPIGSTAPVILPSSLYQIAADGKLVLITADIPRPNGVALSTDERTLYVANTSGEWVYAFELDSKGTAGKRRDFAKLATPPAQGSAAPVGRCRWPRRRREGASVRRHHSRRAGVLARGQCAGHHRDAQTGAEPGIRGSGPQRAVRGGQGLGVPHRHADAWAGPRRQVDAAARRGTARRVTNRTHSLPEESGRPLWWWLISPTGFRTGPPPRRTAPPPT